jgi:hypothetical protein
MCQHLLCPPVRDMHQVNSCAHVHTCSHVHTHTCMHTHILQACRCCFVKHSLTGWRVLSEYTDSHLSICARETKFSFHAIYPGAVSSGYAAAWQSLLKSLVVHKFFTPELMSTQEVTGIYHHSSSSFASVMNNLCWDVCKQLIDADDGKWTVHTYLSRVHSHLITDSFQLRSHVIKNSEPVLQAQGGSLQKAMNVVAIVLVALQRQ